MNPHAINPPYLFFKPVEETAWLFGGVLRIHIFFNDKSLWEIATMQEGVNVQDIMGLFMNEV